MEAVSRIAYITIGYIRYMKTKYIPPSCGVIWVALKSRLCKLALNMKQCILDGSKQS